MSAAVAVWPSLSSAARKAQAKADSETQVVELFSAIDAEQVGAKLIPRDSKRLSLFVENKTDKPLSIRMPVAFVGAPVLAQLFPDPGPFPPADNRAPQIVGAPGNNFPGMNFPGAGPGAGRPGGFFGGPGVFSVPAGKTIKVKVPCGCLQHGRPDPKPKIPYEIKPLESFTDKPEVRELLALFGRGRFSQRVAQIAAWHLTDEMGWAKLDGLRIKHLNGRQERQFSRAEVEAAKKMVAQLPSVKAKKLKESGKKDSLSRR